MHDIVVISNTLGHLNIFITITCNPNWPEKQNALFACQISDERLDLRDRIFCMKLKLLLKHLKENEPFGKLTAFVSVIEFRKLRLVDAHIFSFHDDPNNFTLQVQTKIDNLISAEIPPVTSPHLRELVLKYMIHATCSDDPNSRFMIEGRCSKTFQNHFVQRQLLMKVTTIWVTGRSRKEGGEFEFEVLTKKGNVSEIRNMAVDNLCVLPYSQICFKSSALTWTLNSVFLESDPSNICSSTCARVPTE